MSGSVSGNTIGSGSDSITLNMAEDQALGTDAQFTVNVDGQQIGGVPTVTASQSSGQTEPFTFLGNFAPGQHDVTVSFVNNFIYPGLSGDRNLYVDGVAYDGQTVSSGTTPIYETALFPPNSTDGNHYGGATFQVNDTTPVSAGAPSTPTTTPSAVSVGSGADTLVLNMAEDAYQGDAQFTVSVDGKQIGGTQTTTASVDQGQYQEFDVHGDFGGGSHTVTVNFLNDYIGGFYPGTQLGLDTEDRNLYVMGASLNGGSPASGTPWELSSDGPASFSVTSGSNPGATAASSGLFMTDGAAANGSNAVITSASLSSGSGSNSMSFVSGSGSTGTASGSTASTPSGSPGGSTSGSGTSSTGGSSNNNAPASGTSLTSNSTDPTSSSTSGTGGTSLTDKSGSSTLNSAVGSTTPSVQDVSSYTPTGSSQNGGWSPSSSSGSSGTWSNYTPQSGQWGSGGQSGGYTSGGYTGHH